MALNLFHPVYYVLKPGNMEIEEFDNLNPNEQDDIIRNKGLLIINDIESNVFLDVYKVEDFYVQVSYELTNNDAPFFSTFNDHRDLFCYEEKGLPD